MADDFWKTLGEQARGAFDFLGPAATPISGPLPVIGKLLRNAGAPEAARYFDVPAGHLMSSVASIPAAPTALYTLLNAGVNAFSPDELAKSVTAPAKPTSMVTAPLEAAKLGLSAFTQKGFMEGLQTPVLPGAQGAMDATQAINTAADELGAGVAGEKLQPGLINDNDLPNKIGTAAGVISTVLPAPTSVIAKTDKLIKGVRTGVEAIDAGAQFGLRALEAMLPFTMSGGKSALAANAGAALGGTAILDYALNDYKQTLEKQDKSAPLLADRVSGDASAAVDNLQGLKQAASPIAPFQINTPPEADDDYVNGTIGAAALAGVTAIAYLKRAAIKETFDRVTRNISGVVSDKLTPMIDTFDVAPNINLTKEQGQGFINRMANGGSQETMLGQVKRDGTLPGSPNLRMKPLTDHVDALTNMGTDGAKQFDERLMALREIVDRIVLESKTNPGLLQTLTIRHPTTGLRTFDETRLQQFMANPMMTAHLAPHGQVQTLTPDLWNVAKDLFRDPEQLKVFRDMQDNMKTTLKYLGPDHQAYFTEAELNKITRENPYYLPVDLDEGSHFMARVRDKAVGSDIPRSVLSEYEPYLNKAMSITWTNQARRLAMSSLIDRAKAGDPRAKSILGREFPTYSKDNASELVQFKDHQGNNKVWSLQDPMVAASMKMESPVLLRSALGLMQDMRIGMQRGTTGPVGFAVGAPFSPLSAAYNTLTIAALRDKQLSFGLLDKLVRDLGFKPGIKVDPSVALQIGDAAVRDFLAKSSRDLAERLTSSLNQNGLISKMLGPTQTASMAAGFRAKYNSSMYKKMLDEGVGHGFGQMDASSYANSKSAWLERMKQYVSDKTPDEAKAIARDARAAWNFFDGLNNIIANSPVSALYRQNVGRVDSMALSRLVRESSIDASKTPLAPENFKGVAHFASTLHHGAAMTAPYYNISVQSLARLLGQIKKDPIGTSTGIAMATILPNVMAMSWNASLGKEYSDYQLNVRDNNRQASSLYIGVPGLPPEYGFEFPIDALMGPFHLAAQEMVGYHFGLHDGTLFKPENHLQRLHFVELAGRRARENFWAAADRLLAVSPPPAIAGASPFVLGSGMNQIGPQSLRHELTGGDEGRGVLTKPRIQRMAGFDSDRNGQLLGTKILGGALDRHFEESLKGILGSTGQAIADQVKALALNTSAGNSTDAMLNDATELWKQSFGDRMRMVSGPLWNHAPRRIMDETTNKELSSKIKGTAGFPQFLEAYKEFGYVGSRSRGYEPVPNDRSRLPPSPEVLMIVEEGQRFNQYIDKFYKGPIRDDYDYITKIQSDPGKSPSEKRQLINDRTKAIQNKQGALLDEFNIFEHTISKRVGRKIDFSNFDPSEPLDRLPKY